AKERASRLEGSFGNEKNHYLLKSIRARTQKSEILWIFFGIHTANALNIGRRIQQKSLKKVA
ncbi:MAG: transposase, partial [Bacteroidota bacterium]